MRLKDKIAVVTGGASGFGEAIAERFALEGARVVIADLNDADGREVALRIDRAHGAGTALFQRADVSSAADIQGLIGACTARFGRLDIMVNNAGISQRSAPVTDIEESLFDRLFAVNVKSIYLAAREVVPLMKAQGGGVILNTVSTAAHRPRGGMAVYSSSKGAALTLTQALAQELAKDRIRVNAICPVAGETPMALRNMTPERRAMFEASIPMGRLATPSDVAHAAVYLASDEAAFITGVSFPVDGGRCVA